MTLIEARYRFHAIGQGLFASGNLKRSDRPAQFRWVYDCGTHSAFKLVTDALDRYQIDDPGDLDLLTLSHFDKDHINGVGELMARSRRVHRLLLPYMPLWQRMLVAFSQGVGIADVQMQFFINPVAYLQRFEGRIGEILFVPSTEGPGPSPEEGPEPEDAPPQRDGDEPWRVSREVQDPTGSEARDFEQMLGNQVGSPVHMLKPGSSLRVENVYEFVPYNDARYASKVDAAFRAKVEQLSTTLLSNHATADQHLRDLRDLYDLKFGKSLRNEISLFLYGGFAGIAVSRRQDIDTWSIARGAANGGIHGYWHSNGNASGSVLYTGDGTLESVRRLNELIAYLRPARISQLGALQVMHHGSKHNWHQGVAARIAPSMSVFCSDPAHRGYQHPDAEVVRDFMPYAPIQVDTVQECDMHSRVRI